MNKITRCCAATALIGSMTVGVSFASPAAPVKFSDVPSSHWAYSAIEEVVANGWASGVGNGKYNPDGVITGAELVTMLAKATCPEKIPAKSPSEAWYAPYNKALGRAGIHESRINNTLTQADLLSHIGYMITINSSKPLSAQEILANEKKIPNGELLNGEDSAKISDVYAEGLAAGIFDKAPIDWKKPATRAQASEMVCRLVDWLNKNGKNIAVNKPVTTPSVQQNITVTNSAPVSTPATASTAPSAVTPVPAGAKYGPVGTLSDFPVELSYATHKPVVDYWSQAPSAVRNATDKDVYNALVQTLKDKDKAGENRQDMGFSVRNPYYNYPVFIYADFDQKEIRDKQVRTANSMSGSMAQRNTTAPGGVYYWDIMTHPEDFSNYPYYKSYIDQITPDMSDMEKAKICLKAVNDKFDYSDPGTGYWENESPSGPCSVLASATSEILSASGIPVICGAGKSSIANHDWLYALLDGTWYGVDPTLTVKYGQTGIKSVEEIEKECKGYDGGLNTPGSTPNIAKTIFEQAGF